MVQRYGPRVSTAFALTLTLLSGAASGAQARPTPGAPDAEVASAATVVSTPAAAPTDDALRPPSERLGLSVLDGAFFQLDPPDLERVAAEDAAAPAGSPLRIGVGIPAGIELGDQPEGWRSAPGGRLWLARVFAPGARGLRLRLEELALADEVELWVHGGGEAQGPLVGHGPLYAGHAGQSGDDGLWTQDFWSPVVVVELWVPAGSRAPERLSIPKAQFLYRDLLSGAGGDPSADGSGNCNVDVLCSVAWHPLHEATVRVMYTQGANTFLCSGALLATQAGDLTPYLLTANHCVSDDTVGATVQARFFNQTLSCNGANQAAFNANHARVMATDATVDVSLLMLDGALPAGAVWAGWTTASIALGESVTMIHHPSGDRKKVSFGTRINYPFGGGGGTFYWGVDLSLGTIEGGSSGSPLYRDSDQLLVGVTSHSQVGTSCAAHPNGPCGHSKFSWFHDNVVGVQSLLVAGTDDAQEPNDDCNGARALTTGVYPGLVVKSVDEDWYSITAQNCDVVTLRLDHTNTWGDVDVVVTQGCGGPQVAADLSANDTKILSWQNLSGVAQDYRVRVFLSGSDTRNDYALDLSFTNSCFQSFCNSSDSALIFCPCGNIGTPDSGCDNSAGTGGVLAQVSSFDPIGFTAQILCTGFPPAGSPSAILIRGNNKEAVPVPFGDGLRCVGLTGFVRLAATTASGGVATHSFNHGAGTGLFHYQSWYRNTAAFCTPAAFNLSNGVSISW